MVLFLLMSMVSPASAAIQPKNHLIKKMESKANCGVLSLAFLMSRTGDLNASNNISHMVPVNTRGYSIAQLQAIAVDHGLSLTGFRLTIDDLEQIPMPIIIHVPVSSDNSHDGHFCILTHTDAQTVNIYDPQLQASYCLDQTRFAKKWQGVALVQDESLIESVKILDPDMARQTFGGSDSFAQTPSGTGEFGSGGTDKDPGEKTAGGSKCGTPVWSVNMVNMNIVIQDVPLWYDPPIGPQVQIALTYNSKYPVTGTEAVGPKWTLNCRGYLQENTSDGSVMVVMPDGRRDVFTSNGSEGYNKAYKVFNNLEKLDTNHFRLTMPDDTVFLYQIPAGSNAANPLLVEWQDVYGHALTMGYDASARLISITDPVNQVTTITYTNGHVTRVDDPFGRFAEFEYDTNGNLTRITDMGRYWTSLAYDEDGYPAEIRNEKGATRFYVEPSDDGREIGEYPAPGATMQAHTRITVTDPEGGVSEYYYNGQTGYGWYISPRHYMAYIDENNNNFAVYVPKIIYNYTGTANGEREEISNITYQEGTVTGCQYNYDSGLVSSISDYEGNATSFSYNNKGRLISISPPDVNTVTYDYNSGNLVDLEHIVRSGIGTCNITYNGYHQATRIEDEQGHVFGPITYDGHGRIDTVTETANGYDVITEYEYYAAGVTGEYRLKEIKKDGSVVASCTYDTIGRVRTATDATGLTLTYDYNDLNHITRITYPDGKFISYSHCGCCPRSVESVTDRAGRTTYYTYDKMQRLTSVQEPGRGITQYEYDANGKLVRMEDANGRETRFEYDDEGRLYRKYDADGKYVEYGYNNNGLLETRTSARGIQATYSYTAGHKLSGITYSDSTSGAAYTYDSYGRLNTITDGLGTHDYDFFNNDRLATVDGPWANDTISYGYDNLNRIHTITPQGGRVRTLDYDNQGRLDELVVDTATFDYGYQGVNPLVRSLTRPNGSKTGYDYNGLNQLTLLDNKNLADQVISQFSFQYNGKDLIDNETITQSPAISGFTEDLITYNHNALNQLAAGTNPNRQYTYDDDGNQTGGFTIDGHAFTADYDANERLKSIEYNDGATQHRREFVYGHNDFLGRILRYENAVLVEDVRIVRDGSLAIQERDASNTVTNEYVWGLNRGGGIGGLLSMRRSGQDYDYLYDGKGNVSAVTDNTHSVVASYRYDAFGRIMTLSGTLDQPFRFSTKRYLVSLGLNYYGYRFYDPATGRWLNRDPLGEAGGINLYGFVQNDPVNFVDPAGQHPGIAIGAIAGAFTGFKTGFQSGSIGKGLLAGAVGGLAGGLTGAILPPNMSATVAGAVAGSVAGFVGRGVGKALSDPCSSTSDKLIEGLKGIPTGLAGGLIGGAVVGGMSYLGTGAVAAESAGAIIAAPVYMSGDFLIQ